MAALWALVVVLCVAVAVLFTMLGQLAARLAELGPAAAQGQASIRPLPGLPRGQPAPPWAGPPLTAAPGQPELYGIVVLSTTCAACTRLAAQLATAYGLHPATAPLPLGIALSAPSAADASRYIQQYALERIPVLIDERGRWSRGKLGVTVTPSIILIRDGHVRDGFTMSEVADVATVAAIVNEGQPAGRDQRFSG